VDRVRLFAPDAADLRYLAANLREADVQELRAVHGPDLDLEHCLRQSVLASEECFVACTAYGEPMAVFGVAPISLLGGEGCPWMLGTESLHHYGREIVTLSRAKMAEWGRRYGLLFNYVDARNTRALRWLKRSGFGVFAPAPYGVEGRPFHRVERCT